MTLVFDVIRISVKEIAGAILNHKLQTLCSSKGLCLVADISPFLSFS